MIYWLINNKSQARSNLDEHLSHFELQNSTCTYVFVCTYIIKLNMLKTKDIQIDSITYDLEAAVYSSICNINFND